MEGTEQVAVPEVKPNTYSALERAMGIGKETPKPAPVVAATPATPTAAPVVDKNTPAPQAAAPTEAPVKTPIDISEMSADEIDAMLEKITAGKVKSLAEINKPEPKSAEEIKKEAEQRESEAIGWAIDNKKLTKTQYEEAVIGKSKTDRDLALVQFTKEVCAEDKDITAEEAEEMFRDAYHESDPESKLYKVGQKEIKKFADAYRKENFGILDNIQDEYGQFAQLQDQFKGYKTNVKKLVGELPKELEFTLPYQYLDGDKSDITYKIPVDEKVIAKLLADASSEGAFVNENVGGKIDEKQFSKKLMHNLKAAMYDIVIPKLLEEHTKEVEKRMEVVLGNKRMPGAQMNNGAQNTRKPEQKQNTYSALERAMAGRR